MKLVIDASNIFEGGSLTHLVEVLRHAEPAEHGFGLVDLWACRATLERVEERKWLRKRSHSLLESGYLSRYRWKLGAFRRALGDDDLVYVPSTGYHSVSNPVVTMCRNLMPMEREEIRRFLRNGAWKAWLRSVVLRRSHLRAYRKADGVIFLNDFSRRTVEDLQPGKITSSAVIPHGVNPVFMRAREDYVASDPFTLLYVSTINFYKHQWVIAEAAARLHEEGLPLRLRLVGNSYNRAHRRLEEAVERHPVLEEIMEWEGSAKYGELPGIYRSADAFVFGSTCETFGMPLLEAMASSLPIACSDRSSMGGMLKDGGIYYNPLSVSSCMDAIRRLYGDRSLRRKLGRRAHELVSGYDWGRCAEETFRYLRERARS